MKTYKVTDKNVQCRGFQYELGKTYSITEKPMCCSRGFHSCQKLIDCFKYYDFDPQNRVFECNIGGEMDINDDKIASQEITLLRELTWHECLELVNTGKNNTGRANSGDRNSGYGNSGYGNSGDRNSGDRNSGYWNSGYGNSGDGNSCDFSSGFFNSHEAPVYCFNKPTNLLRSEIVIPYIPLQLTEWVNYTQSEMDADPNKKLIGGYLKAISYKDAWANWEKTASDYTIQKIKNLPNYDPEVFFEITGLDWRVK